MFRNYLTIAIRNLWRNKTFSLINIAGLALGMAFALSIGVFVWGEFQVNAKLKDKERIYFVLSDWNPKEMGWPIAVPPIAIKSLYENYPNLVENYCRLGEAFVNASNGENRFYEDIMLADSSLLTMFGFKLSYGDAKTALSAPYSVVITKKIALKYFNRANVLNEILILDTEAEGKKPHKITGIFDDLPRSSLTEFDKQLDQYGIFVPVVNPNKYKPWGEDHFNSWWTIYGYIGIIKLKEGVLPVQVEKALNDLVKKHAPAEFQGKLAFKIEQIGKFHFTKLDGILYKLLVTISIITAFILLMGVINFVNLTIGSSINRFKEIGLRKTLGGNKRQLIFQFLSESLFITIISAVLALLIYEFLKPSSEQIFERQFPSVFQFSPEFFLYLGASILLLGILAGLYPAFILSSYKTSEAVKGRLLSLEGKISVRKVLVILQITLAVATISIALLVTRQISFLFSTDLGYDKQDVLTVKGFPRLESQAYLEKLSNYKNEFLRIPGIESASLTHSIPTHPFIASDYFFDDKKSEKEGFQIMMTTVDENYFKVFNIPLLVGDSFFPPSGHYQRNDIVINESAARLFGVKNIDGFKLKTKWNEVFPVTGIVKDFHLKSLHEKIKPTIFFHIRQNGCRNFCFKLNTKDRIGTITAIKLKYEEFFPDSPFETSFIEDDYNLLYKEEFKLQKAVIIAVGLSIVIVIIGIIGIVLLNTAKRKKELGIRKVQGASVGSIVWLFVKEFIGIILIANLLAWVMAYFFIERWLQNFAYRIDLIENLWIFLLAGIVSVLITGITICIQTFKTALENPVKSLKDE